MPRKNKIVSRTCRNCDHRQIFDEGSTSKSYCTLQEVKLTTCGFKKIKAGDLGCDKYQVGLGKRIFIYPRTKSIDQGRNKNGQFITKV